MDLLLEIDDAIAGIENKLFAAFQAHQPQKYLDTVKSYAQGIATLRGQKNLDCFVAILAPRSREREVSDRIGDDDQLTFVSWETVLQGLGQTGGLDPTTTAIRDSFIQFMNEKIAFMPEFPQWCPHLTRRFDDYGSPLQHKVVHHLWEFFPDSGKRLSNVKTWVGYYFCVSYKDVSAWFGFLPSGQQIETGSTNAAELVVATSFPLSLPSEFRQLTLRNNFFGRRPVHAWAIGYDRAWATPDKWREVLDPLNKQVETFLNPLSSDAAQPMRIETT